MADSTFKWRPFPAIMESADWYGAEYFGAAYGNFWMPQVCRLFPHRWSGPLKVTDAAGGWPRIVRRCEQGRPSMNGARTTPPPTRRSTSAPPAPPLSREAALRSMTSGIRRCAPRPALWASCQEAGCDRISTRYCRIRFAMPADLNQRLRNNPGTTFYCPKGHAQHYTGKSAEQKLKDAEAREVALRDQLHATEVEAENLRVKQMRERHRIANGVCPCCNRSFENIRRHIMGEHPDFDPGKVAIAKPFKCSCGRSFETIKGLRTHQGHQRGDDDWWKPSKSRYWRHLTVLT